MIQFVTYDSSLCCWKEPNKGIIVDKFTMDLFNKKKVIVCNKSYFFSFYQYDNEVYDIIELFVFLYPQASCSSNIFSIYKYLTNTSPSKPKSREDMLMVELELLEKTFDLLLNNLTLNTPKEKESILSLIEGSKGDNWFFSDFIMDAIGISVNDIVLTNHMKIWNFIPEFKDDITTIESNKDNQDIVTITTEDIENEYFKLTAKWPKKREEQKKYSLFVGDVFTKPIEEEPIKNFVFAEAGTGIGKTIGYLSAVFAFLKKNPSQQVMISTYSKALQKQIIKQIKEVIQNLGLNISYSLSKGSNNYICLLNYETLLSGEFLLPRSKFFLSIIARWLLANKDGDLIGGEINPLLFEIFGNTQHMNFILNKPEDCTYSKCKHFKKCFVMKAKQKAKNSNIIVSNHSHTLLNKSLGVKNIIFDEAHHLFSTSDEIFAYELSVSSLYAIKHWICGGTSKISSSKYHFNGIKARLSTYLIDYNDISHDEQILNISIDTQMDTIVDLCQGIVNKYSIDIITNNMNEKNNPYGSFFHSIYNYVIGQNQENDDKYYTQEASVDKNLFNNDFLSACHSLHKSFNILVEKCGKLYELLNDKQYFLSANDAKSLQEIMNTFESSIIGKLLDFINMIEEIPQPNGNFIYRFQIIKEEGKIVDVGFFKNYINPMQPFAYHILENVQNTIFTSATLQDEYGSDGINQESLISRFGLNYMQNEYNISQLNFLSPFDYEKQTKVMIVPMDGDGDLHHYINQIFLASGGGGLAIFTAIGRLKSVYGKIFKKLSQNGIRLIGQHINNQPLVNLINIFKDDENSCLLGTDAARDGIDIPGNSLKMVIFEKIPWSKPDILFNKRIKAMGSTYGDEIVKYKLRQAFGRLIRKEDDRGVFIILSKFFPSKFNRVFPVGVKRVNLEECINIVGKFYGEDNNKNT